MATTKISYAYPASITVTLASLANNSARQSTVIDNNTNLYLDSLVGGSIKTATGTLAPVPYVNVYVYALTDGVNYSGGATGSDSSYVLKNYKSIVLLSTIYFNSSNTVEYMSPKSVAACFGGVLPQKWGVIVENQAGVALDASSPGSLSYTGILSTVA